MNTGLKLNRCDTGQEKEGYRCIGQCVPRLHSVQSSAGLTKRPVMLARGISVLKMKFKKGRNSLGG